MVGEVGGPALPPDASKLIGMALVWRGWDLRRGEFCFGGEWEARGELRRRFLPRENDDLRGRRPWEVMRLRREGERECERDGWRDLAGVWLGERKRMESTLTFCFWGSMICVYDTLACWAGG